MNDVIAQLIGRTVTRQASRGTASDLWQAPLVGYARADDPLFPQLKSTAHPGHLLPGDLLEGARSVIVYFLPFQPAIVSGNAQGEAPSRAWAEAYQKTNALITLINAEIASFLNQKGYRSGTIPPTHDFDPETLLSPWSHRHAAFASGLGTLGLNRMLITEKGCCGRIGSMVTELELAPSERTGKENCLYLRDGSCGVCVDRCPCGALGFHAFERHRCYERLLSNENQLGLDGHADVCGKCCCGLPCSLRNPCG